MRLIDADALPKYTGTALSAVDVARAVENAPTIDPLKHGEWKSKMLDKFRRYEVTCSECGAKYIGDYDAYDEPYEFSYCPNCGTRMERSEDD